MRFHINRYNLGATLGKVASTRPVMDPMGPWEPWPLNLFFGPLAWALGTHEACCRPRQDKARQTARQDQLSRAKAKQARQPSQISKGQGSQGPMQGAQKTNILCKKNQKNHCCEFSDTYGSILDGTIALFLVLSSRTCLNRSLRAKIIVFLHFLFGNIFLII